jgi:hypothetical protein
MSDDPTQTALFPEVLWRPVEVCFDEPATTSDGGALLLKGIDEQLGLSQVLAEVVRDGRQQAKVRHQLHDLVRQRAYGLALGYEDANDVERVGSDPMHRVLLDRDPYEGKGPASQPTISRFENGVSRVDLLRMGLRLATSVLDAQKRRRKRVRRVTVDFDGTDDPTHGQQQLALFNGFYDCWCYQPLLGFVTFDGDVEQHLVAAVLRSGRAHAAHGAVGILERLFDMIWTRWPAAQIRVRLDGGFATPELLEMLDRWGVEYAVGWPSNPVVERLAEPWTEEARQRFEASGERTTCYGQFMYRSGSWSQPRRVVVKAEMVTLAGRSARRNLRFVVTNMKHTPANLYRHYRARGDVENRVKELIETVEIGRTSCSRFTANQLRLLLSAIAYVLLQALRGAMTALGFARLHTSTLRLRLLKIGGRIHRSTRRLIVHLCKHHPWRDLWLRMALSCGALSG